MRTFGLIGTNLDHSWSKTYFDAKFQEEQDQELRYENLPLQHITDLKLLIQNRPDLKGLNVTIPFKEKVIGLLDIIDPASAAIGAVNVIRINRQGNEFQLEGFNTDAPAFLETLQPLLTDQDKRAMVLGTGGASKAVQYALRKMGLEFILVSRAKTPGNLTYNDLNSNVLSEYRIIINATPLGMHPETESFPAIPYEALTQGHLLYDLVYNPEETLFLKKAKAVGARTKNGLEMLHLQAEMSWKVWIS
jgi:shikimate dehydrogenase